MTARSCSRVPTRLLVRASFTKSRSSNARLIPLPEYEARKPGGLSRPAAGLPFLKSVMMPMRIFLAVLALSTALIAGLSAAPNNTIWNSVAVCNPFYPTRCMQPSAAGAITVEISGSSAGGTSSTFGAAFPAAGTAAGFYNGTNMVGGRATALALADVFTPPTSGLLQGQTFPMWWNGATFDRAPGSTLGQYGIIRDAAGNARGANVNASNQLNVIEANSASILSAVQGPIPTQANTVPIGAVGVTAVTTGASAPNQIITTASTNCNSIKASGGTLYGVTAITTSATVNWVKYYDTASLPVAASITPVLAFAIPASASGAGFINPIPSVGVNFNNGIGRCVTGGYPNNDNTNAVAGTLVNELYK